VLSPEWISNQGRKWESEKEEVRRRGGNAVDCAVIWPNRRAGHNTNASWTPQFVMRYPMYKQNSLRSHLEDRTDVKQKICLSFSVDDWSIDCTLTHCHSNIQLLKIFYSSTQDENRTSTLHSLSFSLVGWLCRWWSWKFKRKSAHSKDILTERIETKSDDLCT
jgi:hypothetical protein